MNSKPNPIPIRRSTVRAFTAGLLTGAAITSGIVLAAPARADTPGCTSQLWWRGEAMRMTVRTICDGPIRPDGSWLRGRNFHANAYWTNPYTSCYRYGCTYYPSRFIPAYDSGNEFYDVTPPTVLPDEPGHIGAGAVA